MDLNQGEVDVAIRFGYGPDDGLYPCPLASEWLTPVMLPALAEIYPTPADLLNATLIHSTADDFLNPPCDWPAWLRAAGVEGTARINSVFSQPDHALDAAMAGVGVVLGLHAFVVKSLAKGRLVVPYGVALSTQTRFRFLCHQGQANRPAIVAFRDWVLAEFAKNTHVTNSLKIVAVEDLT